MADEVRIIPLRGMPEVQSGDDIAQLILDACSVHGTPLEAGDIVVVTQKVVSKAEGRVVDLEDIVASDLAHRHSAGSRRDPRHTEAILRESARVVRMDRGIIISETRHGFICANAGVDASNVPGENTIALLPVDPDGSAASIRRRLMQSANVDLAVIISDTFGRPWREGATNVAIGVAGMSAVADYRGQSDSHGHELFTTVIAVADELAAAAELVTGKVDGVPVSLIRGYRYTPGDSGARALVRPPERDLFR